ncbi:hypothetical protein V6N12_031287 [Hibiscus sabdariffa]|uniref:Putative plant transposon protein domain-containing protein n=1 Tax=Hibiscus sabdariffa TaxID=183260 RepID=A0ABR2E8K4_9ROSI
MAHSPSSSAEGMPSRFQNAAARTRYYNTIAQKKIWEEQGFFLDDGAEYYGFHNKQHTGPAQQPAEDYELIGALEEEDFNNIKDQLCLPGTEWNTTGKNPGTISRPHLLPEAKLWNTFVKCNIMPTSHNQTVDKTRMVVVHAIISGYKFDVGEVIAKELADACHNDKGILAFPCIISALCP